jgi:ankyrin repeat protein
MALNDVLAKFDFLSSERKSEIEAVGFDDNKVDTFSILEYLIRKGHEEDIKNALENGHDVNTSEKGDFGSSLLHVSIRYEQMAIFENLIEKGADLNFIDNVGWTPLMESVVDDKPAFTEILVEKGADKNLINQRGASAIALAQKFGRSECLRVLS